MNDIEAESSSSAGRTKNLSVVLAWAAARTRLGSLAFATLIALLASPQTAGAQTFWKFELSNSPFIDTNGDDDFQKDVEADDWELYSSPRCHPEAAE